jgi:hypothetical protein
MRHDMESCDQCEEDRDEAWLDGPVASMKGKLEALKRGSVSRRTSALWESDAGSVSVGKP